MKIFPFAVIFWMALSAISCGTDLSSEDSVSDGSREFEIVDYFLSDFTSQNIKGALDYLSDDFKMNGPGLGDSLSRSEWVTAWDQNFEEFVDSLTYERVYRKFLKVDISENPILAGNWVLEWGRFTARFKDQTTATFWWHGAFRFVDEEIVLVRVFMDNQDVMLQRQLSSPHDTLRPIE